jgi:hypothetical protein
MLALPAVVVSAHAGRENSAVSKTMDDSPTSRSECHGMLTDANGRHLPVQHEQPRLAAKVCSAVARLA